MSEILNTIKDWITPLSLLLVAVAGVIDNSKKIAAKPLTKCLSWLGNRFNADLMLRVDNLQKQLDELREQQLMQEAYELNDFYNRHANGEVFTREQYELAIAMYHRHINKGANHVDKLHLKSLEVYYLDTWG